MRVHSSRRAQGVIEYILIATAVVVVLIVGVLRKNGPFVQGVDAVTGFAGERLDKNRSQMNFTTTP